MAKEKTPELEVVHGYSTGVSDSVLSVYFW